ncbi:MAG: hypothetical protein OEY67_02430 [Gammaproteobacteria bacterium]|nr:hypothetical protein [Gammaproteobacteria bacterium]
MMNNQLNEIIQSRGGLFWLEGEHNPSTIEIFETITSIFNSYTTFTEKELYKDKPRKIVYGILNGSTLNALAYASPSSDETPFDFIGINVGTIFTLLDVFGRILSHPDNFPEIGNASLEDAKRAYVPYLSTDIISSHNSLCFPNCPVRSIYSSNLATTALTFLFFHEITHLRNGHLEFIKENTSYIFWQEALSSNHKEVDPLILQTLEMDADCGAVLATLNKAFNLMKQASFPKKQVEPGMLDALKNSHGDGEAATKTVVFSIYTMFRLFDLSDWDILNQHKYSHPQPPIRMSWIASTICTIFHQRPAYNYAAEKFIKDASNTIIEAEQACGKIKNMAPDTRGILSVFTTNLHVEYSERLNEIWRTIRPQLEIHKRGGNLAE